MVDFKKKLTLSSKKGDTSSDIISKFKKRKQEVLEKTWNRRSAQSSGGQGRDIYNHDKLEKYGIQILPVNTQKEGEYYFNQLPQSFDDEVAAHEEVAIHYQCGIKNDQMICMERYTEGKDNCHRCNVQKEGWRKYGKEDKKIKKQLADMYPQDKVVYLLENLGPKYLKDEEPDGILYIKDLPKKGVHAKIQDEVRDKKTGKMIDIADLEDEGRLIYMKVTIKEDKEKAVKFPEYGSFDLMDRDIPIHKNVLKTLSRLIEDAEAEGMTAIQYLLRFPEDGEMEKIMETEVFDFDTTTDDAAPKTKKEKEKEKKGSSKKEDEIDIEELEETLNNMKTTFSIKRFCKENDISELIEDCDEREEMIEAILTHFSEQ